MDGDGTPDAGTGPRPSRTVLPARAILVGAVAALVVIAVVVALRVPQTKPPAGFAADEQAIDPATAVVLYLQIDSVDANKGTVSARIRANPGPALGPRGARVSFGDTDRPELTVGVGSPSTQETVTLDDDRGTVANYPFDEYELDESVAAVPDGPASGAATDRSSIPVQVVGASSAVGFTVHGSESDTAVPDGFGLVLIIDRARTQVWWAVGMMAIDWALAVAAVAVVVSIAVRSRPWETRHLAWLGSMIFALAAFRNTAPGNPPIGVFLDLAAFFWAEAFVVAALLALVVVYLGRDRRQLDL